MNTITVENIKNLDAKKLTQLLLKLLHLENNKFRFPDCNIYVPENITTADGGEDGRILTSDFKGSKWIVDKFCLFQSKATSMARAECKNEILNTANNALKRQVKEAFDRDGTYILFTIDDYVQQNLDDRIEGFRYAIKLVENEEYASKAKIKIYDANLIKDWVNEYISAISFVQLCCGIQRPLGLQIWEEFESYQNNTFTFKTNPEINSIISKIRNDVYNKKSIRIEGVSGIGKSRLICEALSPDAIKEDSSFDVIRQSISSSVIYFDIGTNNSQSILDFIKNFGTSFPAILVLDNCEPSYHKQFLVETQRRGSLISIITIDYEKWIDSEFSDCELIELKSESFKSVVEEILIEGYSNKLNSNEVNYLIEFSEGNPRMAIKFVESALRELNLGNSFDDDLVKKLIFGRSNHNENEFNVLRLFSAFKYFEYPKDEYHNVNPTHYETLKEHFYYFSDVLKIEQQQLRDIILKYLQKGVLERRGNKIVIRPNPLSLKLSLLYWNALDPSKYVEFITKLPNSLRNPLVEQLQQLGNIDKAKELVETIWGVNGNFSKAEILNSNMGSRLFRSIVSVNPEATIKVLIENYLDKPKVYLLSIVEGRQNIVWALEKLCFREKTFIDSAKVLMCLAAAEIETYYSNNATDYFTQLFRIYLAGTEAGFDPRIEVLKWAVEKKDIDFDGLVIKASERAFTPTYNLHKMMGAEKQGGLLPLEDYRPNSNEEINKYREKIIELLSNFLTHKNPYQLSAQRVIYDNINDLFEFRYDINKLKDIIDLIILHVVDKNDLIKSFYKQASFIRINQSEREFLIGYIEILKTNSIEERILYNVSEPKIIIKTVKDGNGYIDRGKILAEKFAEDVISENINIRPYFKNLLNGNQYNSFDFGKKLSELMPFDQDFNDELLKVVLQIENESYNISFFFGYISSLEMNKKNEILNYFILKKSSFAFNIFRFCEINFENILKLIVLLIDNNNIKSDRLEIIKYDIINLKSDEIINYFKLIKNLENGNILIFSTFHTLLWNNKNESKVIDKELLIYVKSVITDTNILLEINNSRILELYAWEEIVTLLIDKFQSEICSIIAGQIVEFYENLSLFSSGNNSIANIANITLNIDFENCWNIYSKLILEKNTIQFWNIFDMSFISGVGPQHPFFNNDSRNDKLLVWLLKNREVAPWIARVAPLFDENAENWFLFTEVLINIFGKDKHFIDKLSCNLHSMFTVGSRVPYLKSRLKLVELLKDHRTKAVKDWALQEIENYNKSIKIEEISDEEGFLGFN
jgi:hypothetical protein